MQEQPCHHRNDRQLGCQGYIWHALNILMHLTSFLGVHHNLCSEFVLDIGRLKEILCVEHIRTLVHTSLALWKFILFQ